jgi:hypothetical protein
MTRRFAMVPSTGTVVTYFCGTPVSPVSWTFAWPIRFSGCTGLGESRSGSAKNETFRPGPIETGAGGVVFVLHHQVILTSPLIVQVYGATQKAVSGLATKSGFAPKPACVTGAVPVTGVRLNVAV